MTPKRLLSSFLFLSVAVYSQTAPAPIDTVARVAVSESSNGRPSISVTCFAQVAITGIVLEFTTSDTQYYDAATEPRAAKPIPPSATVSLPAHTAAAQVAIKAAVLADGTTAGDPEWINKILQRRKFMADALTASLNELKEAVKENTTREKLQTQFQNHLNNELSAASNQEQKSCIRSVRGQVLLTLRTVKQSTDGTPLDITTVIEGQIQSLTTRLSALNGSMSPQLR